MSPESSKEPPESARKLRSEVLRIRRRARATLLLEAFLAAVAADLLYYLAGIAVLFLTGRNNYFPPFVLVIFTVLALYALWKTRFLRFSRRLDREQRLKERLTAAESFRLSGRVPPEIVEAQARESLAAIDFPGIRKTFRPRLVAHLGVIALLTVIMGAVVWRFPGIFTPLDYWSRQGRQLVGAFRHKNSIEDVMANAKSQGGEERKPGPDDEPDEAGSEEETGDDGDEMPAEELPPAAEEAAEPAPEEGEEKVAEVENEPPSEPPPPEESRAVDPPPPQEGGQGQTAASSTGGTTGKAEAVAETTRPSPLAEKPYAGLAPEPFLFDREGTKGYLPPIPLFKLFAGSPMKETLIDPDAINIVPEAYEEKYRRHIIAYFEKLQSLRGDRHGP